MQILSNLSINGTLGLNSVADANTDTDKFLVIDSSGIVKYRTGAELYSDIGAGGAAAYTSVLQHTVKAGEDMTKGQAVYVSSADGTNMIVSKASNASEQTSSKTLGIIAQNMLTNDQGFVVTEGLLSGIDTSNAAAGDPVWLGTNGNLLFGLLSKPYAPAHLVFIGIVTRAQQNNGEIFVKVQNGFELNELHNVQITTTPSDNTVLSYEYSSALYKMKSIPTILGYTPADSERTLTINGTSYNLNVDRTWNVGTTTGSGASGQVAYWNGTTSQTGSSSLFWDATLNRLGVGLNNPQRKVEIYSTNPDSHLRISGSAPSVSLGEAITGSIYQAKFGLATSSGHYSSSAAAGDFVIISQTGATIWVTGTTDRLRLNYSGNFSIGNTNDTYKLDVSGTGRFSSSVTATEFILDNGSADGGQLVLASSGYGNWNIDNYSGSLRAYYGSTEFIRLMNNGQLRLNTYTSSSAWTGTAVATLGVDSSGNVITITGGGVTSFNTRTGAVTLSSSDVTTALGYTPYNSTNPNGYITSYTETDTLSSVTGRGNTTSSALYLSGAVNVYNTNGNDFRLYHGTANSGSARIYYDQPSNQLRIYATAITTDSTTNLGSLGLYIGGSYREVLHTSNYSSYALPLSGGTMTGIINFSSGYNAYIYTYGRTGLANGGRIIYNNGTGSNMFFGELGSNVYGFTGNLYSDIPTIAMDLYNSRVGIGTATPAGKLHLDHRDTYNMGILHTIDSTYVTTTKFGRPSTSSHLAITYDIAGSEIAYINRAYSVARLLFQRGGTTDLEINGSGNSIFSGTLSVSVNANQVAYFQSPNPNTWVDIISTTRTWSLGSTASSTFAVYDRASNVTRMEVDASSNLYAYGSMRAPIFYDSNDTTYYGDFNGTSRFYQAIVFGDSSRYSAVSTTINGTGAGDKLILYGNASNYDARVLVGTDYDFIFKSQGSPSNKGMFRFYSGPSASLALEIRADQNVYATATVYSAAYRGNANVGGTGEAAWFPAGMYSGSTQWLYGTMYRNGSSTYYLGGWEYQVGGIEFNGGPSFQVNNSRNLQLNSGGAADVGIYGRGNGGQFAFQLYGDGGGNYGFLDGAWAAWDLRKSVDGALYMNDNNSYYLNTTSNSYVYRIESATDMRAPIFYDSQDTGYYLDPNSTSLLNYVRVANQFYVGNGSQININYDQIWRPDGGQIHIGYSAANNIQLNNGGGYTYSLTSLRAPIFYDYNDTSYYLDPNGSSMLSTVYLVGTLRNNGSVAEDDGFGIYWDSSASGSYGIFREGGSWSWPYPDLRIAFHTGIKIGANAGYNGVRFYTDYDMSSQVMSVNNADDGFGGGNVYINNSLKVGSAIAVDGAMYGTTMQAYTGGFTYGQYYNSGFGLKIYNTGATLQHVAILPDNITISTTYNYHTYYNASSISFNSGSSSCGSGQASYGAQGLNGYDTTPYSGGYFNHSTSAFSAYSNYYGEGIECNAYDNSNLYIGGTLYQNHWSDEKYKDNVLEIEDALDKVKSIRGVEYDWNELAFEETGREGHDVGVIAQEVQSVYPFAVREVDKEKQDYVQTALVVDYEKLIPLLVQSVKELSAEVDVLKIEVQTLKGRTDGSSI